MEGEVGVLRLEGRRLGRYRVVRRVGGGGMGVPAPMRRWGVRVPVGVERVVQRALAKGWWQRWRSCEEFLRALERPSGGEWVSGMRSEVYMVAGVVLLVVLGVVGLLVMGRGGERGMEGTPTEAAWVVPTETPVVDFSKVRPLPSTPTLVVPGGATVLPEAVPLPMPALPGPGGTPGASVPSDEVKVVEVSPGAGGEAKSSGVVAEEPVAPEKRLEVLTLLGTGMGPVIWGPGSDHLFLTSGNQVYSYNPLSGEQIRVLELGSKVFAIALAPDGRTLAVGDWKGFVTLWDLQKGANKASMEGHQGGPMGGTLALAFSPDGTLLASGGTDGRILLWDAESLSQRGVCRGHTSWVRSLAFSPDGKVLASGGMDNTLRLWDVGACREIRTPLVHGDWVMDVAFSPRGDWIASASWDGEIRLWGVDGAGPRVLAPDRGGREILALAFSPEGGQLLVSGDLGGTVRFWDAVSGRLLAVPKAYGEPVVDLAFSPDGKDVVCALRSGEVKVLDMVRE